MISFTFMLKTWNKINIKKNIEKLTNIVNHVGYDVIRYSNDEIFPVDDLDNEAQKIVVFDDFVCEKNQKPLIDYFIRGRQKNCSVIYLSQSFYKTPKDIRLNCSNFCVYEFPSSNERNFISRELQVTKEQYQKATQKPFSVLYVDKPMMCYSVMTQAYSEKEIPSSPNRSRTYDLPITSSDALPLSYRRLVGAKAIKLGSWDKHPAYC